MITPSEFWDWFKEHHAPYLGLANIDDEDRKALLDLLADKLHEFCDWLSFEIGKAPEAIQALTISADGDTSLFDTVKELVAAAPVIDGWQIIAFKQPAGSSIVIESDGAVIDTADAWFVPITAEWTSDILDIRILVTNYSEDHRDAFAYAGYRVVDAILGEWDSAFEVEDVEVRAYMEDVAGLRALDTLRAFVDERIRNRND